MSVIFLYVFKLSAPIKYFMLQLYIQCCINNDDFIMGNIKVKTNQVFVL